MMNIFRILYYKEIRDSILQFWKVLWDFVKVNDLISYNNIIYHIWLTNAG